MIVVLGLGVFFYIKLTYFLRKFHGKLVLVTRSFFFKKMEFDLVSYLGWKVRAPERERDGVVKSRGLETMNPVRLIKSII